ncbi:MAG TPA: hypothetical protein VGG19_17125 [Tepidisphaeraceae bacterium]|jgi:hypothetical protein
MGTIAPQVILRLGSHAEKEYFEKLAPQLDAVMFGSNLLEITPTATASFLALLREKRNSKGVVPYYLDPITYCFGAYIDPETGRKRIDLEALKSERTDRKTKKKFVAVKDSYSTLAKQLGPKFEAAVNDGRACAAIDPALILPNERDLFCRGVLDYQEKRIASIISSEIPKDDAVMLEAFAGIGSPAALFAPYFFIHETWADEGFETAIDLISRSVAQKTQTPIHGMICASHAILRQSAYVDFLIAEIPKTRANGIWLWFDGFDECEVRLDELIAFRRLVKSLASSMKVFNLHGGFFSLLLGHDGMTGISHGVGYGEKKPVAQVIGAAAPTVRYYLPPIRKRAGVPDIQRCFPDVPVKSSADFFKEVCDCTICKGVIGNDVRRFAAYGEMHRANATAQRDTQTSKAAKICRFHFLLNRMKERGLVASLARDQRAKYVIDCASRWRTLFPMRQHLGEPGLDGYIEKWAKALDSAL